MPNITLSEQEKEILLLGQEFKKLKDSPAYQKTLGWLTEWRDSAFSDMISVAEAVTGIDQVARATIAWNERWQLLNLLEARVNKIVEEAKTLAESIAEEAKDAEI